MVVFLLIPCLIAVAAFAASKSCGESERAFIDGLDRDEHPLKFLYPLSIYVYKLICRGGKQDIFGNTDLLREIYVDEKPENSQKIQGCKCLAMMIAVIGIASFMGFAYEGSGREILLDNKYLERNPAGKGETAVDLLYSGIYAEETGIRINVSEKKLSGEELEKLKSDSQYYIDKALLKNETAECVRGKLNLIAGIPGTSIKIKWSEENSWFLGVDGSLKNADLTEPVSATLHAVLTYFDESWDYEKEITIYPPLVSEKDELAKELNENIEMKDKETQTDDLFELPTEIHGVEIEWNEEENSSAGIIILLGLIGAGMILPGMKQEIKKKQKRRTEQMMRDYPDIISKFVMLISAGMTCRGAWGKICGDYLRGNEPEKTETGKSNRKKRVKKELKYAYEEMLIAQREMDLGMPEIKVYERFGTRCAIPAYNRFGNMLARNIKRGSAGIIEMLEAESRESFAERRENVRKKGEEAGTKLLLPMFGMLILVIAIVVVPAFSSF